MHLFSGKHEMLQHRPEGNLNGNDIRAHTYTLIHTHTCSHTDTHMPRYMHFISMLDMLALTT